MSEQKSASNEEILAELRSLRKEIQTLADQNQGLRKELQTLGGASPAKRNPVATDLGIKFMLDEFGELGEFWRHADSRMESAINFYLTSGTIVVSAVVVPAQRTDELRVFLSVAILLA